MDKRKLNKGTKGNKGGRKSKAEEQQLIEKLSPLEDLAHSKLQEAIEMGKDWAIKMYFEYMYGKPKQAVNLEGDIAFTSIERRIINDTSD